MLKLIRIELYKLFSRKRSYIGFAAVIAIILIAQMAMLWEGQEMHDFIIKNLSDAFYMHGNLVNGYLMTFLVLNFLWVHVPLLVVLITADLFSGEAHGGTFRLLLSRPVSRGALVTAKFSAAMIYTFILMLIFAVTSLGMGTLLFGTGDLIVISNSVNILPENDVLWRFLLAFSFGFVGMAAIASLSLMLSAMASNSLGPILSTMALIIFFTMISSLNFNIFGIIRPFLLTSYLDSWQMLFRFDVPLKTVGWHGFVLLLNVFGFYGISLFYFGRKDILS